MLLTSNAAARDFVALKARGAHAIEKPRLTSHYQALVAKAEAAIAEFAQRQKPAGARWKPFFDFIEHPDQMPMAMEEPYRRNFPIKSERISFDGIKAALALNYSKEKQEEVGPFRVVCVCAYDNNPALKAKTTIAGGMIFTVNDMTRSPAAAHTDGLAHLSYTFVTDEYRQYGVNQQLLGIMDDYSRRFIAPDNPAGVLLDISLEQHIAQNLSFRDFYRDCISGVSPPQRQFYWGDKGYEQIDLDFAHPSVQGGGFCEMLGLYMLGYGKDGRVHRSVVSEGLRRDFGVWYPHDRHTLSLLEARMGDREYLQLLPPPTLATIAALEREIKAATADVLRRFGNNGRQLLKHFGQKQIAEWLTNAEALTKPMIAAPRLSGILPPAGLRGYSAATV